MEGPRVPIPCVPLGVQGPMGRMPACAKFWGRDGHGGLAPEPAGPAWLLFPVRTPTCADSSRNWPQGKGCGFRKQNRSVGQEEAHGTHWQDGPQEGPASCQTPALSGPSHIPMPFSSSASCGRAPPPRSSRQRALCSISPGGWPLQDRGGAPGLRRQAVVALRDTIPRGCASS